MSQNTFFGKEAIRTAFDWEDILGDPDDLQEAWSDLVWKATERERRWNQQESA